MKEEKTGGFVLRVVILIAILILPAGCSRKAATADPVTATNTAGTSQAVFVQSSAAAETVTDDVKEVGAEETITEYYIGANFNGYAADDENYKLTRVDGYENVYLITVALTAENADQTYQAHYYKITNGTWTANSCWGMETYALSEDKRPVNEAYPNAGLGAIYIPVTTGGLYPTTDRELTIYFNSETKAIADSSFYVMNEMLPVVYGNFLEAMGRGLNWSLENGLPLYDDNFDGIYEGTYLIPAYTGTADGYTMYTCLSKMVYYTEGADPEYTLGANEQVAFAPFKPAADMEVTFQFDIRTKTGTIMTP